MSSSSDNNTVYLISGANRGLGFAFVEAFLDRPNTIVFAGVRDPSTSDKLHQLQQERDKDRLHIVKLESTSIEDHQAAARYIQRISGHIDVIIANAGIADYLGPLATTPIGEFQRHYEVNTIGPVILFQSMYELLVSSTTPKFIVMSSGAGSITLQSQVKIPNTPYGASKAAANYITRKIQFENEKIIAFPLSPGWVQTDMGTRNAQLIGMKDAPLTINDSIPAMVKLINEATRESHSGRFFSYDGTEIPW